MALLRVMLDFAHASDHVLEETAGHVLTGLYGNAQLYPAPPVGNLILQGALTSFTSAVSAQAQGGPQATAAKDEAARTLVTHLRQLAMYVQATIQATPSYGLAELLLSGFDAVSTSRAQHPLAQPQIMEILNAGTGQLQLRVGAVPNARMFEVQRQSAGGPMQSAGGFSSTRHMVVTGLTPGTMYNFQVRAVGGSEGYSQWSDALGHMSL